jgi:Tol biopolymer transport system component
MRTRRLVVFALATALIGVSALNTRIQAQTAAKDREAQAALQAAVNKEFIDGDVEAAIDQYKKIASNYRDSRAVGVKALVRLGHAYAKSGNAAEARRMYEQARRDYPEQTAAVAEAEMYLKALGNPAAAAFSPRELSRVCTDCDFDAVSPDGRYLLGILGWRDLDTGREGELDLRDATPFAFSGDGKQIAYTSCCYELRIAPFKPETTGKPIALKTILTSQEYVYFEPFGWSPDGKEVFAVLQRGDLSTVIATIPAAGGDPPRLIKSLGWDWPERIGLSPDGRSIVYDAEASNAPRHRNILLLATSGGNQIPLVQHASWNSSPLWTPDGKSVVFLSDREGTLGLWRVKVDGGKGVGEVENLRQDITGIRPLAFTRDGLFLYETGGQLQDVYVAGIDLAAGTITREPYRAVDSFAGRNLSPAFSPDGKSLAYLSQRSPSGHLSLIVRTLASGTELEIPTTFKPSLLTWFPDSRSVLLSERNFIQRIDVQSGEELMKQDLRGAAAIPSPDGKRIYFIQSVNGEKRVVAYDLQSRQSTELYKGWISPRHYRLAVSPDGVRIAFTVSEPATSASTPALLSRGDGNQASLAQSIYVVSTTGGTPQRLRSPASTTTRVMGWSTDGKDILAQRGNGHLWWVPADGGEARRIGVSFPNFETMSPDLKQIALNWRSSGPPTELWADPYLIRPNPETEADAIYTVQMDSATGSVRGPAVPLASDPTGMTCAPAWSPDGRSLAFKRPGPANVNGQRRSLWVVRSMDTGAERAYSTGGPNNIQCWSAPVWFHDGKSLLNGSFLEQTGSPWRTNLETGQTTGLGIPVYKPAMALSPDDKTLYLTAHDQTAKTTSIVAVNMESREQRRVWTTPYTVNPDRVPLRLAISPDGRTLALVLSEGSKTRLVRVGVDGSGYKEVYSREGSGGAGAGLSRSGLAWSRDGRALYFMEADGKGGQRLMRIAADGSGKPQFTGLTLPNFDAVFDIHPDGRSLVLFSPRPPQITAATIR